MKCSCAAELSFNSDARHLAMKESGVIAPVEAASPERDADWLVQLCGALAHTLITCCGGVSCKMPRHSAGRNARPRDR